MKKFYFSALFTLITGIVIAQNRFWIATTSSNWNNTANWSTTSGGAGGASVPGPGNVAVFNGTGGRNGSCNLDVAATVGGITINGYTGTVDLQGNTLTTTGVNIFTTGTVANSGASAVIALNTTGATTFNGTLFNVPISGLSGRILFSGSTFNGTVSLTKTDATNDDGAGGNTFNAAVTLTKTGTGELRLANTNADIFASTLTINQNAAGAISLARIATGTQFNGDITVNYNATGAVSFGANGGTSTLANTRVITTNAVGTPGNLTLSGFTQIGTTAQNISLPGNTTGTLTIGPSSTFNGAITTSSPVLVLNASTFTSSASFTQNSNSTTGNSRGGNLFQGVTSFTNNGDADLSLGTNAADPGDIFNGVSTFTDLAGGRIRVGEANTGNIFNAAATFISAGANDLNNRIQISRLTGAQTTFNASATFINNGNSSDIHISLDPGTLTTFNGPVIFTSGTSAAGQFEVGREGNVVINGNVEFNSTCSDVIQLSSGTGSVTFGNGVMAIGSGGFALGELRFENFTQTGSTAQSLTLTGTSILRTGAGTTFNGNVNFTSPRIFLSGATFNGTATLEKNGATGDTGTGNNTFSSTTTIRNSGSGFLRTNGGNIFNGTTTIVNSGSADVLLELASGSTYNGNVTLTSTGTSSIRVAFEGNTNFNGNIVFNSTGSSGGIIFCESATASAALAATRTISIGGSGFSDGDLRLQRFTQTGATNQSLTLTNVARLIVGPTATFNGNVNFVSPQLFLHGATYNGTAFLHKNGITDNTGNGGNIFNGATTIVHSGSNSLITGNANADTFNGTLTVTNSGSGIIYLAHNVTGSVFNGNVAVNSTGISGGIYFSNNATGSSTLASGRSIAVGGSGFSAGELRLFRMTQLGTTAQSIMLTGASLLRLASSTFNGAVTFISPQVFLATTTFNGITYLEKTGTTDNTSTGGNVFSSTTTLVNSGSGSFEFASTSPETFNGDLTITNSGQSRIQVGIDAANNVFNGNVTINHGGSTATAINTIIARNAGSSAVFNGSLTLNCTNSNSSSGLIIGNDGNATINGNVTVRSTSGRGILFGAAAGLVTLANGFTITAPAGNYTTGTLTLKGFTQVGPTAQTLNLSGTADLVLGSGSTFNGNVNFVTPQIHLNGTTFNGTTYLEKTGAIDNSGTGSNIFNGVTTIVNSGSGIFLSGSTSQDIFNNNLTLTNTGLSSIRMADDSPGNLFNGDITVNSTSGAGIYFGNNAGATASLADGRTIMVGGSGFTAGELRLRRFSQLGGTPQTITLTTNAILRVGSTSTFNGNATFSAPRLLIDGTTFNGTAFLTKTGALDDNGTGGNTFNSTATINNTGTGYLLTGNVNPDIFNGDLNLNNSNVASIRLGDNSTGNQFNGNINVTNTAGLGILFSNTSGSSTLASGGTITVLGTYNVGELRLRRFTQLGSAAQTITLTGTALIRTGVSSTFNGAVTFTAPQILLEGATFNGVTTIEKNGATNNDCPGSNVFNSTATIINSSAARLRLASTSGDTFNGATTFRRSGTGLLEPAYSSINYFSSDITCDSNGGIIFGTNGGTVECTGGNPQVFYQAGLVTPSFNRLVLNKSGQTVTLNTIITATQVVFTSGILRSSASAYPNIVNNGTVTGANDLSYVEGPIRKTGDDVFTFPVGAGGFYRPLSISAPSNTGHAFTAQYFASGQTFGGTSTWDPTFWTVSGCEYWVLDRNAGASAVTVTLSWNENACGGPGYVTNPSDLRVTRWNGTSWVNHGNGGVTGNAAAGTVVTSAVVGAFSPFTLASTTRANPLPVELKKFWAVDNGPTITLNWITASESANKGFTVQRSPNGIDYTDLYELPGAGTTPLETSYLYVDEEPLDGVSYYRLKQTDYTGEVNYPGILSVHRRQSEDVFRVYPNPAGNEVVTLSQKSNIVIINSLDQVVARANAVTQFNVSHLPAGVYIIRNQNGEVTRLVKK